MYCFDFVPFCLFFVAVVVFCCCVLYCILFRCPRPSADKVLLKAIAPYTRVKLPYLASELNGIPLDDVEDLLVSLILDGKVDGKIDQVCVRSIIIHGSHWSSGLSVETTIGLVCGR